MLKASSLQLESREKIEVGVSLLQIGTKKWSSTSSYIWPVCLSISTDWFCRDTHSVLHDLHSGGFSSNSNFYVTCTFGLIFGFQKIFCQKFNEESDRIDFVTFNSGFLIPQNRSGLSESHFFYNIDQHGFELRTSEELIHSIDIQFSLFEEIMSLWARNRFPTTHWEDLSLLE